MDSVTSRESAPPNSEERADRLRRDSLLQLLERQFDRVEILARLLPNHLLLGFRQFDADRLSGLSGHVISRRCVAVRLSPVRAIRDRRSECDSDRLLEEHRRDALFQLFRRELEGAHVFTRRGLDLLLLLCRELDADAATLLF